MKTQFHSKSRAVSPIIATILLVALVVVGGALTFVVLAGIFTGNAPLDLEVEAVSDFRSENGDVRVDRFQISISNLRTQTAVIKRAEIFVYRSDNSLLTGWRVPGTSEEYLLSGKQTVDLTLRCFNPDDELLPQADRIYVEFLAYRSGDTDGDSKNITSSIVAVGQTYGPVSLSVNSTYTLDSNLTLTVRNNGTTALNLVVELSGEPQFLFTNLTTNTAASYKTASSFSLEGVNIDAGGAILIGPETAINMTWFVNATAGLASGTYFVAVWITDSSFRTMAFTLVPFSV